MNTSSNHSSRAKRLFVLCTTSRCLLIAAGILTVLGYMLMSGPGSSAQSFNPDIFSPRRIVVAPTLCLSGYLMVIVAILRYGKDSS